MSVLLDGEENEIIFIDHPAHEMSVREGLRIHLGAFVRLTGFVDLLEAVLWGIYE